MEDVQFNSPDKHTHNPTGQENESIPNSVKDQADKVKQVVPKVPSVNPYKARLESRRTLHAKALPFYSPKTTAAYSKAPESVQHTLLETYKKPFPAPGYDAKSGKFIVFRGCQVKQLILMMKTGSAGGMPVNVHTKAPDEKAIVEQVGEISSLPEFTTDLDIAKRFGRAAVVIACEIDPS